MLNKSIFTNTLIIKSLATKTPKDKVCLSSPGCSYKLLAASRKKEKKPVMVSESDE